MQKNLTSNCKIYDQLVLLNEESLRVNGTHLTNIVYMGMGEPLLNYKNVLHSIDRITASDGMNMSPNALLFPPQELPK